MYIRNTNIYLQVRKTIVSMIFTTYIFSSLMKISDNWESLPEGGNLHVPGGFLWGINMLKVKEESEKVGLKLKIQKTISWHLVPSLHGK